MTQMPEEARKVLEMAEQRVSAALGGLTTDQLMVVNALTDRIDRVYSQAMVDWHNRTTEDENRPAPRLCMPKEIPDYQEDGADEAVLCLNSLSDNGIFNSLVFGALQRRLAREAQKKPGRI